MPVRSATKAAKSATGVSVRARESGVQSSFPAAE